MKFTALLLLAAVAPVSAGNTAYYKVAWKKAAGAWSVELGGTLTATVASGTEQTIVLPTNFLCKPGAIPVADVTDAADPAATSNVHCSGADGKTLTSLTCDTDGKKLKIKVGAECTGAAMKLIVTKSHIFPIATVTAKDTVLKVGTADASTTDGHYVFMNVAAALGAKKGTDPKVTLSNKNIGKTGTFTYETTLPADVTQEKTDKVCLFYPGFTLQKGSCNITVDTTAAAKAIAVAADAADKTCLTIAEDDQIPKASKKFKVVCDKFQNPTASQISLGFGVAFTDESASSSLMFDALAGQAITASAAPTRAPTAPTRAPTRAFSAAPRSATATGAAGFVSAVVAYFLF
jgi:hypothetical protein